MTASGERWVEVTPSQFAHEQDGLERIRAIIPDETPFRAWSNVEFRDSRGRWHEVDLLLLGRGALHLIELKYYSGTLRGDDQRWARDGRRPEDSPLKLARRKAQYLASRLTDELRVWAAEKRTTIPDPRDVVPFVQESVFLHHPDLRCLLSSASAKGLFGLDGNEHRSGLPGISELVLAPAGRRAIGRNQEGILVDLLARIGLVQRREREAGSWVIQDEAIDSGTGWQDWLASHKVVPTDRARIRFHVLPASANQQDKLAARRVAEHEFRLMSRLQHDGLLRPRDLVESELGVGTVYPYDPQWQRLDLWLAGRSAGVPLATQLSMVRQVGEALQYAHNNRVVHRGLSPLTVWVRSVPEATDEVKVRVGDWQTAGQVNRAPEGHSSHGVTTLFGVPGAVEGDAPGLGDLFSPPESAWTADADRVRLDVYGLGALAFYLFAGGPPAASSGAVKQRLREQQGLDLAIELPQVPALLRSLVLKATRPSPSARTPDVATFLAQLSTVEREAAAGADRTDPLDAAPGTVLDGRFTLERRLGQGSTAVGLLVTDAFAEGAEARRVLKVGLDDAAAARLDDEAAVLRRLSGPRFVRLVEGPLVVGGRRALLLESAGEETLADALRQRTRLSLDLLERYGSDLLDMLVALDRAGVDHRDIKPSNLGVRESGRDKAKHLVLFDFSLTGAAASATRAGTPPYLDPFLGGARDRYDSAAERYAAAVVLFEMATGATPVYGDGQADPATVDDDARVEPEAFDPALAEGMVAFFRTALAREARDRHHTADAMRTAWSAMFAGDATTQPDDSNDALAATATASTPLRDSGLTARALSALEPYQVRTVGELLTIDKVRLAHMRGVARATREQILARMKEWQARLGEAQAPRVAGRVLSPLDAADLLLRVAASPRSPSRGGMVQLVLGVGTSLDAFATHAELAAHLDSPVTAARAGQLLDALQEAWAADPQACGLLDSLAGRVSAGLTELGEVATVAELTRITAEALAEGEPDERLLRGLLRFALERRRAQFKAGASEKQPVWVRRRGGVVTLLACEQSLFDVAESLGAEADRIVAAAGEPERVVVPAARVRARLDDAVPPASEGGLAEPLRRVTLAAATSTRAAATAGGDLHHRDLLPLAALELTFAGFGGQSLTPAEIRERVRVRFPAVAELPARPALDELVAKAGLQLIFDDRRGVYRPSEAGLATTGLEPRPVTSLALVSSPVGDAGALGARLEMSTASRSFLALGVYADKLPRFTRVARERFGATVLDLTGVLLESLRASASELKVPWQEVRRADGAGASTTARRGLSELVRRAWPVVEAAVDQALLEGDPRVPLLLTEAAPLARYDNVGLLARWTDLAAPRARAVWLLVPQLGGNYGPLVDGRPVPLAAPNQFVVLDNEWIDSVHATVVAAQRES